MTTDSNPTHLPVRRLVVSVTIGSFSIAALMGVIALLGGGDFGEREAQVLGTTLIIGTASVAMLCYLATSGTRYQTVGAAGGIVVLLPTAIALLQTWVDSLRGTDGVWQTFGVGVTIAATLAQMSLLLGLSGGRARVRVVLRTTLALAAGVAGFVCILIVSEQGGDGAFRALGVLAILDVLGTVTTLALALFGSRSGRDSGLPVRVPARLEQPLADAAARAGTSRDDVVATALDRYLAPAPGGG